MPSSSPIPNGRVTVRVDAEPQLRRVTIEVRDSGIGMTPHTIASLFEPFAQAQETLERSSGGLGLGLAVVKGLIELHAGSIEATSPGPGHGATFTVHLAALARPPPA